MGFTAVRFTAVFALNNKFDKSSLQRIYMKNVNTNDKMANIDLKSNPYFINMLNNAEKGL